jgi:protein-tyrosine phosphatase
MLDIHCHILPGVDDGSRSMEESLAMLHAAQTCGISRIVATPHCRGHHWDPHAICQAFQQLEPEARQMGMTLELGAEIYWEKLAELGFERARDLRLGASQLVLLEFGYQALPAQWQRVVYELQRQGLQVVVAHPERYAPVQNDIAVAAQMKELGCYLQVSCNCMEGGLFSHRRKCAKALMKNGLVDYIATDAHRTADYANFPAALTLANKY